MEAEKLIAILKSYCGTDELRELFHNPCKQNGFYYASDAHHLVRIKTDLNLGFDEKEKPNYGGVMPKVFHNPIQYNVNKIIDELNRVAIMRPEEMDCTECDGYGTIECDLGHEHDCEKCDGKGTFELKNGKNVYYPHEAYSIFGSFFSRRLLMTMLNSCKLLGIENINKVSGELKTAIQFDYEGITFILMPLINQDNFRPTNIK